MLGGGDKAHPGADRAARHAVIRQKHNAVAKSRLIGVHHANPAQQPIKQPWQAERPSQRRKCRSVVITPAHTLRRIAANHLLHPIGQDQPAIMLAELKPPPSLVAQEIA